MLLLTTLALLGLGAARQDAPPLESGVPIDRSVSGEAILPYQTRTTGRLYVWASADRTAPGLRILDAKGVERAAGTPVEGGFSSHARVDVSEDESLRVVVTAGTNAVPAALRIGVCESAPLASEDAPAVEEARAGLARAQALAGEGDYPGGREKLAASIDALLELATPGPGRPAPIADSWEVLEELWQSGYVAFRLGDVRRAFAAFERVLHFREGALPEDHARHIAARANAAQTASQLGDTESAVRLFEASLGVQERVLPEHHRDLSTLRLNVAGVLMNLGADHLQRAEELARLALASRSRTPENQVDLGKAYLTAAAIAALQGDYARGRDLGERSLELLEPHLAGDDPVVAQARTNLAGMCMRLGDLERARDLNLAALEARRLRAPEDDLDLLSARLNYSVVLRDLGDLERALAEELDMLRRTAGVFDEAHAFVLDLKQAHAGTLSALGDEAGALALARDVLAARERTLGPEHPLTLDALQNTLAHEVQSDVERARDLHRRRLAAHPPEHPNVTMSMEILGHALADHGKVEEGLELLRAALERRAAESGTAGAPVQQSRAQLATRLIDHGQPAAGRLLLEEARGHLGSFAPEDPLVRRVQGELAWSLLLLGEVDQARAAARELASSTQASIRMTALRLSPRQAEAGVATVERQVDTLLAIASGVGRAPADAATTELAFGVVEAGRAVGMVSARILAAVASDARFAALRREVSVASAQVAHLAAGSGGPRPYADAVRRKELAQQSLLRELERGGTQLDNVVPTSSRVAAALAERSAAVAFRRYRRWTPDGAGMRGEPVLLAFVVAPNAPLRRVELGPLEPIIAAAEEWRASIVAGGEAGRGVALARAASDEVEGAGASAARELRRLAWDPLQLPRGLERVVVVPDSALHVVPLDALPDTGGVLGDRLRIELRATLWELLVDEAPRPRRDDFVAFGDIDYGARTGDPLAPQEASYLAHARSAAPRSFDALPAAAQEVRALGELAAEHELPTVLITGAAATKAQLFARARSARFLHLATHGFFTPADGRGGELHSSGLSPLVLCGLALAGANDARDSTGVLTAEELATAELSGCELAVLSACETGVGEQRVGQGAASLQRALHMAGVRCTVSSLWKVPDAATRTLMVDFYRHALDGEDPDDALWAAKTALRERGAPLRDWAGWIMTGDPRGPD